jgi:hypothetical protein
LDLDAELQRLERVRDEAEFEAYFKREHHRFAHLMVGRQGFMARMGAWTLMRRRLRQEWLNSRTQGA